MSVAHSHHHHEGHSHTHSHAVREEQVNNAFKIGIGFNFLFVLIEVVAGLKIHSLSLLSDAGHNLADVASLALSLFAFRMVKVKANNKFTYGYRKTTILAALFNAVVLLISIGIIGYEAILRLFNPQPLPGRTIAIIAFVGILINAGTALLFFREKDNDINIKSAYLHLASDALVSLALVVSGVIIYLYHWYWMDSVLSIGVAVFIVINTWSLFKSSFRLSLDGVPEGINLDSIQQAAAAIPGISTITHIHVWAISTSQNALTAHICLNEGISVIEEQHIKQTLKHEFEHLNIQHCTLEIERPEQAVVSQACELQH